MEKVLLQIIPEIVENATLKGVSFLVNRIEQEFDTYSNIGYGSFSVRTELLSIASTGKNSLC